MNDVTPPLMPPSRWARAAALAPAVWAGVLLCVALIATPAPFATLPRAQAGAVVAHIFVREAWGGLVLALMLLALARRRARDAAEAGTGSQFSGEMLLLLGTVFLTVLGYFALQPMLPAARAGQGAFSFAQLHAFSSLCFALKTLLWLMLAWRASGGVTVRA